MPDKSNPVSLLQSQSESKHEDFPEVGDEAEGMLAEEDELDEEDELAEEEDLDPIVSNW